MKKQVIAPIGVRAVGAGGLQHPPPPAPSNFGQLRFFGQQEKFGQTKFLLKFLCFVSFFFSLKELLFILSLSRRGNICYCETPNKESFSRIAKCYKIDGGILENEQKRYAICRRVRRLGHTTVSELLMEIQDNVLFNTFPHFSE